MELATALDIVCGATRHERYRHLCDASHPAYDPAYIPVVLALAKDPGPPRPAPAPQSIPLAGDLVAAATKRLGADRLAKYIAEQLGTDCGCEARRVAMNALDKRLRRFLGWTVALPDDAV